MLAEVEGGLVACEGSADSTVSGRVAEICATSMDSSADNCWDDFRAVAPVEDDGFICA